MYTDGAMLAKAVQLLSGNGSLGGCHASAPRGSSETTLVPLATAPASTSSFVKLLISCKSANNFM